jgi:hypothetical protein
VRQVHPKSDSVTLGDARNEFAKKMTPDQIAEAQMRAREWTEAFEKTNK